MSLATFEIRAVDACYGRLRELIMSAELMPNTHQDELALSERLFIEPDDVHVAALRLEAEGLVRTEPSGGFWIVPISVPDLSQIYNQVSALEANAAQFAAENGASPIGIAALRDAIASMDDAVYRNDLTRWARADHHFHRSLVQCCNHGPLIAAALPLSEPVHRARMVTLTMRPTPVDSVNEHTMLVDAIRRGAGAEARDLHVAHWRTSAATVIEALRDNGLDRISITPRPNVF